MTLVGPAFAVLVIAQQSLGLAFAIDTATFVFASVMFWLRREQKRESSASDASDGATGDLTILFIAGSVVILTTSLFSLTGHALLTSA